MKVEVVGTGCPTCKKLYDLTLQAAERIGSEVEVEYVTEVAGVERLIKLGLMQSPALVVNNKVAMTGFISNVDAIKEKILETAK